MSGELKILEESLETINEGRNAIKKVSFADVKKRTPKEAPAEEVKELHRIINLVIQELNDNGHEVFEVDFMAGVLSSDPKDLVMMGSEVFPDSEHVMSGFVDFDFTAGDRERFISGKDAFACVISIGAIIGMMKRDLICIVFPCFVSLKCFPHFI